MMVRYTINCEEYCKSGAESDDICMLAGSEMCEIEDSIKKLRLDRWSYVSLWVEKSKPVLQLLDGQSFEASINDEKELQTKLETYTKMFQQLNEIFVEIQTKHPHLPAPTLRGIKDLRYEYVTVATTLESRIKGEVTKRMGFMGKGKSVDDILADPTYVSFKKEYDGHIAVMNAKITELNNYTSEIKKILSGE